MDLWFQNKDITARHTKQFLKQSPNLRQASLKDQGHQLFAQSFCGHWSNESFRRRSLNQLQKALSVDNLVFRSTENVIPRPKHWMLYVLAGCNF